MIMNTIKIVHARLKNYFINTLRPLDFHRQDFFLCEPCMKFFKAGFVQKATSDHRTVRRGELGLSQELGYRFSSFQKKQETSPGLSLLLTGERRLPWKMPERWGKGSWSKLRPPLRPWPTEIVNATKNLHLNVDFMLRSISDADSTTGFTGI